MLYVDELNLLEANLLDLVLNVLDAGTNRVEREGLSSQHACASLPPSLPQPMQPTPAMLRHDRFSVWMCDRGCTSGRPTRVRSTR